MPHLFNNPQQTWNVLTPDEKYYCIQSAQTMNAYLLHTISSTITPHEIAGIQLSATDVDNTQMIQRALVMNNIPAAIYLLEKFGNDIDLSNNPYIHQCRDIYNNPLIYYAIAYECANAVSVLFDYNAPIMDGNGNITLLHQAIYQRNSHLVHAILEKRSQAIYDTDHNGETPIDIMDELSPIEEDIYPDAMPEQFPTDTFGDLIDETPTGKVLAEGHQVNGDNEDLEQTDDDIRLEMARAAILHDDAETMELLTASNGDTTQFTTFTDYEETLLYTAVDNQSFACLAKIRHKLTDPETGEVTSTWKDMLLEPSLVEREETPFHALCAHNNAAEVIPYLLDTPYDDAIINTQDAEELPPQFKFLYMSNSQAITAIYQCSRVLPQNGNVAICISEDEPMTLQKRITCAELPEQVCSFRSEEWVNPITALREEIGQYTSRETRSLVTVLEALHYQHDLENMSDIDTHLARVDLVPMILEACRIWHKLDESWRECKHDGVHNQDTAASLRDTAEHNVNFLLKRWNNSPQDTPCLDVLRHLKNNVTPRQAIYEDVFWAYNVLRGMSPDIESNYRDEYTLRKIDCLSMNKNLIHNQFRNWQHYIP